MPCIDASKIPHKTRTPDIAGISITAHFFFALWAKAHSFGPQPVGLLSSSHTHPRTLQQIGEPGSFLLYVSTISIILMNAFCPVVRNWDIWRETTHPCVLSWSNPEPRSAESAQISCCLSRFVDNPGEDNAQVCVAAWHCVILAVVLDLSDWSDEVLFRGICMAALLVLLLV